MNSLDYQENGYLHLRQFFNAQELAPLESALRTFHNNWLKENNSAYQAGAINSAYISAKKYLPDGDRETLFHFMMSQKLTDMVKAILITTPVAEDLKTISKGIQTFNQNHLAINLSASLIAKD
ncbi:hypothetical protein [Litorilituus sediminis]|uniref:Uncharacterized protein n=1 Tax=Litorilituus sediminis TaxID=718192 RepID=A0A4P6P145_9GAMM|nr:hypothetical protein [Litorilituus sediminis]QBG34624.1 hypothetical protein EMK97_02150 [Litorilituus sediminis]